MGSPEVMKNRFPAAFDRETIAFHGIGGAFERKNAKKWWKVVESGIYFYKFA